MTLPVNALGLPDEAQERLLTLVLYPSPITTHAMNTAGALWAYAERGAGYEDPDDPRLEHDDRSNWPFRCRVADWLGCRFDTLGFWANRRKAARRLQARRAA